MTSAVGGVPPSHVRESISRHMLADGLEVVPDLERSHGTWLVDARDGREYLDFFTYFSTLAVGHNHPHLTSPAFRERLLRVAVQKPSLSDAYPGEMAAFVDAFSRSALPEELPHLFVIEGGALAVENALKVAMDWKTRKNLASGKDTAGEEVIHFREAFHGRTGYTLSMTNTVDIRKIQYFTKFDWPRIPNPKCAFPLEGENLTRVAAAEEKALTEIRRAMEERGDRVAALIIEPIQGEGGDNHFRGEFLRALREICDQNEIFYILDEVQTGFGATGKMWCFQHFGFVPDAVAFAKKAQASGVMVSRRVDEVKENVFHVSNRLNSTWGGNLVDMVRCIGLLEVIESEGLLQNATERGAELVAHLEEVGRESSGRISNVRGRGVIIAFDLPTPEQREQFLTKLRELGMLALKCGQQSIRFRPPLNVSSEECQTALARVREALSKS
jgi:L-lysine 6-transaminase